MLTSLQEIATDQGLYQFMHRPEHRHCECIQYVAAASANGNYEEDRFTVFASWSSKLETGHSVLGLRIFALVARRWVFETGRSVLCPRCSKDHTLFGFSQEIVGDAKSFIIVE
jgi:hypothetical protein